jgi:hypothetical protein
MEFVRRLVDWLGGRSVGGQSVGLLFIPFLIGCYRLGDKNYLVA